MRPSLIGRYVGEVLLAMVLSLSTCLLIGMIAPVVTSLFSGGVDIFGRRIVFDREGVPRVEVREVTYSHRGQSRQVTWYDLDGNRIAVYPEHQAPRLGFGVILDLDTVLKSNWRGGRRSDLTGWRFLPPPGLEVAMWHKLPYRGLLVGYLYPYGRLIGHIGPDGLIEPGGVIGQRFRNPRFIASPGQLGQIWVDVDKIYSIDLERMTVRKLWTSPFGPIRALGYYGQMGIILCGNKIQVIDFQNFLPRMRLEGELPPDLRHHVAWQVAWCKDRLIIANLGERSMTAYYLDAKGRVLDSKKIGDTSIKGMSRLRMIALTVASSITTPWAGISLQYVLKYKFPDAFRLVEQWTNWPYQQPFLTISLVLTAFSVFLTYRHLRLRSTTFQMVLGLLGTLLLSWPGHLVCRTLFDVAARTPCPACGRPRAVDRPTCPHCRARWPDPPQKGCEILIPPKLA